MQSFFQIKKKLHCYGMLNDTYCPLPSLPSSYTIPSNDQARCIKKLDQINPFNPVRDLKHSFSLCFADASVKHDACYLFKNPVLLMQKSRPLIEFKSDDVMKITFLKLWDLLGYSEIYLPKMCRDKFRWICME